MANDELRNLQQRRAEQKALLDEMLKGKTEEERLIVKQQQNYKAVLNVLKEINEQVKDLKDENKIVVDNLIQQESKLKGLTGIQASLVNLDRQRINAQQTLSGDTQDAINSIASMNQELLAMSAEDTIARKLQKEAIDDAILSLMDNAEVSNEILQNLRDQSDIANKMASLTEKQQEFLNKQLAVYEGIKDTIGGVLETASLLTSTLGGVVGIAVIGLGKIATAAGKVRAELGGMGNAGATFISFFDDNAVDNLKSLSGEFGSVNNISTELQASTSLISANMGISGDEAAKLIGSLSRSSGSSKEMALDMIKSVQATAKMRGVLPSKALKDLAGAAETFALYSKEGAQNLQNTSIYAAQVGVDLESVTKAGASLLDFETSINAELELQSLTGRRINLERARQLALAEKDDEALQEVARQLGGIAGWESMGRLEKQQAADLLGIQVDELKKVIYNQKEVATSGSMIKAEFSAAGEAINAGMNKYLGTTLEGVGGMVIAMGQFNTGLKSIGLGFDVIGQKVGGTLKKLLMWPINKIKGAFGMGGAKPEVPGADAAAGSDKVSKGKGVGERLKDLSKGLRAMGDTKVLFGALNLIPTGLGFVAILPGIPGMLAVSLLGVGAGVGLKSMGVGLKAMGDTKVTLGAANLALAAVGFALMTVGAIGLAAIAIGGVGAAAGLTALAGGLAAFGNPATAGFILMGIGLLALFGAAMIPLTYALSLLAPLVESIGTAIGTMIMAIGQGISMIVTSLGDLMVKILPLMNLEAAAGIFAVAGAFFTLAASLGAVAVAGIAALPALTAVGLFGAVGGAIAGTIEGISGGGEGETANESDSMSELLNEIKGLRADLNNGKVAVYMDGKKVTGTVAGVSNRVAANTYNK